MPRILAAALLLSPALISGCSKEGCLSGSDSSCLVPSPCPGLSFSCAQGSAEARVLAPGEAVPGGANALGAAGDILLGNDQVVAVIDALDHPNYLGFSGGNLLDLGTRGGDDDNVNQLLEVVGVLPGDTVRFTELAIVEAGPRVAAVQVRGELEGRPAVKVATRYEVRACEPGMRIRTEMVNLGLDPELWAVLDGYFWGGRDALPFTPAPGEGFHHEPFDLATADQAFHQFPFLAWSSHSAPYSSYATVACDRDSLTGFNTELVSSAGLPKRIVQPGEFAVFERFISVAGGQGISRATGIAMQVRRQLFGERYASLSGKVLRPDGAPVGLAEAKASVVISELPRQDSPAEERIPWTQVVPEADGSFAAAIPANRQYLLELQAFGNAVALARAEVGEGELDVGTLVAPLAGKVRVSVADEVGSPLDARIVLASADRATAAKVSGQLLGQFIDCVPLLGAPYGGSPACNQLLVRGAGEFEVPSGAYHLYATAGPFFTLGHRRLDVQTSAIDVAFTLKSLPALQPKGTLSADLHLHGRVSYDSSLPDLDRALSFSAAGVDVVAATDHNVVGDYRAAMSTLGLRSKIAVMDGIETTGLIPFLQVPGSALPHTVGHFNLWPLAFDPDKPRRGAPDLEQLEPAQVFDRLAPLFTSQGVIQLNHPWSPPLAGRDEGFPRAIAIDCSRPLPNHDDGSGSGIFVRTPNGASRTNDSYDVQEVMNGTHNEIHLQYRAFWFCLLDQGLVRAGTANSDSHSLGDGVLGTPRNLVFANTAPAHFDANTFNAAVRAGRSLGTNGPVIEAALHTPDGRVLVPGVAVLQGISEQSTLEIAVRAAPWVPVSQVRVVVNGGIARVFDALPQPTDPFGSSGLERLSATLSLAELLPADGRDSWIVVEAGESLPLVGDLDGDGIPDTSDNNGDGVVNKADVAPGEKVGPLQEPPAPADDSDPHYHFAATQMGGLPQAFTNPFVLDRNGDGYQGPGLPGAGR